LGLDEIEASSGRHGRFDIPQLATEVDEEHRWCITHLKKPLGREIPNDAFAMQTVGLPRRNDSLPARLAVEVGDENLLDRKTALFSILAEQLYADEFVVHSHFDSEYRLGKPYGDSRLIGGAEELRVEPDPTLVFPVVQLETVEIEADDPLSGEPDEGDECRDQNRIRAERPNKQKLDQISPL